MSQRPLRRLEAPLDRFPFLGASCGLRWPTWLLQRGHAPTGAMNTLLAQDAPAHDWYRFVLSFPPHLVRDYAQRFGLDAESRVLDPFCGTGTTLVGGEEARRA